MEKHRQMKNHEKVLKIESQLKNGIFGNFEAIFWVVPVFAGRGECHHRLRRPKRVTLQSFILMQNFCWAV